MSQSTPPPQEYAYTLTRELDASAARVFEAWTAPAQYEQWAGAAPGTVKMDARPGGTWRAVMVTPDGQQFPLTGSYLDVVPGRRLVIGMDVPGKSAPATMSLFLDENDGAGTTRITLTQSCDSAHERDLAEQGSTMLLDSLGSYLTKS
ncbi:SRPBCC domain-containing protein [Streptomyces sp. NPDC057580]|uniref:SRPBCC family protein n=1 Tax=Streptomyces sp. NPDC057580 TaxID=3346173 RepID=UPI0036BC6E91